MLTKQVNEPEASIDRSGKFLLALVSTVILVSKSRGTHDNTSLSHGSPARNMEAKNCILICFRDKNMSAPSVQFRGAQLHCLCWLYLHCVRGPGGGGGLNRILAATPSKTLPLAAKETRSAECTEAAVLRRQGTFQLREKNINKLD